MRLVKFLLIILLSIFVIFFFLKIKINFMNGEKISFKNYNFQGIECIDDVTYLISNFDSKIYKLNENFKLEEFLDTSIIYKKKAIFSHITSFYIKNNFFYGINSLDKINGIIVKTPILDNQGFKKLSTSPYEITRLKTNINHVEYFTDGNETLVSHHYSQKSKENVIKVVINKILKCKIENKIKIQNLYYDKKTNNLLIISNLIGNHMGVIYKLPIRTLCKKDSLNFFNIKNKELIFFPFYELESYTFCKNRDYFVYINRNNSYIYLK
jgi:hypothetical protein